MNNISNGMCYCDSQKSYLCCCEPLITGKQNAKTPKELMRSRYTAYTMANIDYIKDTMRGDVLIGFQEIDAKRWAKRVHWISLKVLKCSIENASIGYVVFEAIFVDGTRLKSIHEQSKFICENGIWYYIGGTHLPTDHTEKIISRNMNCPCGNHRKFKNCHGK